MNTENIKDPEILKMLSKLRTELGEGAFDVVDHWEADLCAIGIVRPDNHSVLVYVSTYERGEGRYWVSLELPPIAEGVPYASAGEREVRGIRELASVVRRHFSAKRAW